MRIHPIHWLAAVALVTSVSSPGAARGAGPRQPATVQHRARCQAQDYAQDGEVLLCRGCQSQGEFIGIFETTGDHGQDDNENSQVSFSNAHEMTVTVPKLTKGTYALIWYTISADDGHHAGGWFTFSLVYHPGAA